MDEQQAFSISRFASVHDIGLTRTYEEIRSGRLRIMKIGKRTTISTEAAADWRRDREKDAELGQSPNPKSPQKGSKGRKAGAQVNGAAP